MPEYIERQAAIDAINEMFAKCLARNKAIEAVNSVQARTGRWEERIVEDREKDPVGLFRRRFYCPFCGEWQTYGVTRYCPECGAEMEIEEMEEET